MKPYLLNYGLALFSGLHVLCIYSSWHSANCQLPAVSVMIVLACQTLVFNSQYTIYKLNLKEVDKICDRHQMQNVGH